MRLLQKSFYVIQGKGVMKGRDFSGRKVKTQGILILIHLDLLSQSRKLTVEVYQQFFGTHVG